jgi:hypothetical protein
MPLARGAVLDMYHPRHASRLVQVTGTLGGAEGGHVVSIEWAQAPADALRRDGWRAVPLSTTGALLSEMMEGDVVSSW